MLYFSLHNIWRLQTYILPLLLFANCNLVYFCYPCPPPPSHQLCRSLIISTGILSRFLCYRYIYIYFLFPSLFYWATQSFSPPAGSQLCRASKRKIILSDTTGTGLLSYINQNGKTKILLLCLLTLSMFTSKTFPILIFSRLHNQKPIFLQLMLRNKNAIHFKAITSVKYCFL